MIAHKHMVTHFVHVIARYYGNPYAHVMVYYYDSTLYTHVNTYAHMVTHYAHVIAHYTHIIHTW